MILPLVQQNPTLSLGEVHNLQIYRITYKQYSNVPSLSMYSNTIITYTHVYINILSSYNTPDIYIQPVVIQYTVDVKCVCLHI